MLVSILPISVTSCLVPCGVSSCILRTSSHNTCIIPLAIDFNQRSAICSGISMKETYINSKCTSTKLSKQENASN